MKNILYILQLSIVLILCSCQNKQTNNDNVVKEEIEVDQSKEIIDKQTKSILFFGNSLTAGYRLEEQYSFPSLIQNKIDSLQLNYTVINGGLSGETTSEGSKRIDWILKQKIDVFVLELGANDMLRGLSVEETEKNLRSILGKVKDKLPEVKLVIAGMKAAPNMGPDYVNRFDAIYPKLAQEFDAALIPFLLNGVASIPELNLNDGKHPNEKGQKVVANNVWKIIEPIL